MSDSIFMVGVGVSVKHTLVCGRDESDSVDESYV